MQTPPRTEVRKQGDTQRGMEKKNRKTGKCPPRLSMLDKTNLFSLPPYKRWLEWAISIEDVSVVGCLMCEVASLENYNATL